jgi:hypothetical protein
VFVSGDAVSEKPCVTTMGFFVIRVMSTGKPDGEGEKLGKGDAENDISVMAD